MVPFGDTPGGLVVLEPVELGAPGDGGVVGKRDVGGERDVVGGTALGAVVATVAVGVVPGEETPVVVLVVGGTSLTVVVGSVLVGAVPDEGPLVVVPGSTPAEVVLGELAPVVPPGPLADDVVAVVAPVTPPTPEEVVAEEKALGLVVGSPTGAVDPSEDGLELVVGSVAEGVPSTEGPTPELVVGSAAADAVVGGAGLELGAPEVVALGLEGSPETKCCTAPVLNLPTPVALAPWLPSTL